MCGCYIDFQFIAEVPTNMKSPFIPESYFDISEARKFVGKLGVTVGEFNTLFNDYFWLSNEYFHFVLNREVLPVFCKYIVSSKSRIFSRSDFYCFFFNTFNLSQLELKKLKLFALEFEKRQTDALPKTQFKKLIQSQNFELIDLKWLKKNNLIITDDKVYRWTHHSLTEYLVASYLLTKNDPVTELDELSIFVIPSDKSRNLIPSWYGVISFMLDSSELQQRLVKWLFELFEHNEANLTEQIAEYLTKIISPDLTRTTRTEIFEVIYKGFQKRKVWISSAVCANLAKFYQPSWLNVLKNDIEGNNPYLFVAQGNVADLIGQLAEAGRLPESEKEFWGKKLVGWAQQENSLNSVLQRRSLAALAHFKELDVLKFLRDVENTSQNLVLGQYLHLNAELAPNSPETISLLLRHLRSFYARDGILKVETDEGIYQVLNHFITNAQALESFIEYESSFDPEPSLSEQRFYNEIIKWAKKTSENTDLIIDLVYSTLQIHSYEINTKSHFIHALMQFLGTDISTIEKLLNKLTSNTADSSLRLWTANRLLASAIRNKKQWLEIENLINKYQEMKRFIDTDAILGALRNRSAKSKKLYLKIVGKKKAEEIQKQIEQENEKYAKKYNKVGEYEQFKAWLGSEKEKFFYSEVFNYYLDHAEVIKKHWRSGKDTEDRERLIWLAFDDGVKRLSPRQFNFTYIDWRDDGSGGKFSWSKQASFYGDQIKVLFDLKPAYLKTKVIQQHLINFVSYSFSSELSMIETVVKKVTPQQLDWLNNVYSERDKQDNKKHLGYFNPDSYIHFLKHLENHSNDISSSIPVLKSLVMNNDIPIWKIVEALELLGQLLMRDEDKKFFKEVFKKYSFKAQDTNLETLREDLGHENLLAVTANSILITSFKNLSAIEWRIKKIIERMVPESPGEKVGVYTPSDLELESRDLKFAKPLIELCEIKYFKNLTRLVDEVWEKYPGDHRYDAYKDYVWKILFEYVRKIVYQQNFEAFHLLERYVESEKSKFNPWMIEQVRQLKLESASKARSQNGN